jgi:hypothetical protein
MMNVGVAYTLYLIRASLQFASTTARVFLSSAQAWTF